MHTSAFLLFRFARASLSFLSAICALFVGAPLAFRSESSPSSVVAAQRCFLVSAEVGNRFLLGYVISFLLGHHPLLSSLLQVARPGFIGFSGDEDGLLHELLNGSVGAQTRPAIT